MYIILFLYLVVTLKTLFRFSVQLQKWGLEKVEADEPLLYICEVPINKQNLMTEERSYQYGYNIDDTQKVPRGPYFIKQPSDVVFDGSRKSITNDVTLRYVLFYTISLSF